jgi:hypothetical protein
MHLAGAKRKRFGDTIWVGGPHELSLDANANAGLRASLNGGKMRAMPLKEQEKDSLRFQLGLLLEFDEPEAILGTMRRVAERKAYTVTRGLISVHEAKRWTRLGEALRKVEDELERLNAPRQPRSDDLPDEPSKPADRSQFDSSPPTAA